MNHQSGDVAEQTQKANALKFSSLDLSVKTIWLEGPVGSINFNNSLLVTLSNSRGELEDLPVGLFLQYFAVMPSMGHPMDDAGTFERISKGIYLNSTIKYNMPGDWKNEIWVMDATYKTIEAVQWNDFF
jgi:hypothetical protein